MTRLHFEDLHVGDCWQSRARTITETDVVNFACMTGDFDPLHVDHEFAKSTPFGKPIAHGLLGLAWVAGLGSDSPSVNTAAFLSIERWEFHRPAHIGDTVRAIEVQEKAVQNAAGTPYEKDLKGRLEEFRRKAGSNS